MSDNNNRLDVTTWFFDFVERSRGYFNTQEYQMLKDVVETVNDLTAWAEGVEADNDSLRKEIARLKEERNEIRRSFCQMVSDYEADAHGNMETSKEQVATNNGWDCFKEESK